MESLNQSRRKGQSFHDDTESSVENTASTTVSAENTSSTASSVEDKSDSPEPRTILDANDDPFSTEASRILFDSIDELRRSGAGQVLDLPQLVIVGKQATGKSSLLQSLTDIPFPAGDGLCTQFATRIISRRTAPGDTSIIRASIEPGDVNPFNYAEDPVRIESFARTLSSITVDNFSSLIKEAKEAMGLSSTDGKNRTFSSLVLKIELSGPERSHFGILDIPGVYSNRREATLQGQQEMDGVKEMVISYMKKRENIVICVADATDDIHNQVIFDLAEKHVDIGDASRVVGVYTKCDQVINPKARSIVKSVKDGTGIPSRSTKWFVVQNIDAKASTPFDREREEAATFSQSHWQGILEKQRGTPALKRYLANLLCRRIGKTFPEMQDTVAKLLQAEKSLRQTFGNARETAAQRRAYLMTIVKTFQDMASQALHSPGDLPSDNMKLRGVTGKRNGIFAQYMMTSGHYYNFLEIGLPIEEECDSDDPDADQKPTASWDVPSAIHRPQTEHSSIPPIPSTAKPMKLNPLYREIRRQIDENRGEELTGMLNPAVLKPLWAKQTKKWREIAEDHLNTIISLATGVALRIFDYASNSVAITERAKSKLVGIITSFAETDNAKYMQQLHDLCHRNATMALQTVDPAYGVKIRAAQQQRFSFALGRFHVSHPPKNTLSQLLPGEGRAVLDTADATEIYRHWIIVHESHSTELFNEIHPHGARSQNIEDEIHDILRAYYDVTLQSFLTHVISHIIEPFLTSASGPLFGLSEDYVMNLSDEEVEDLGGEDERIIASRKASDEKIATLENAKMIAANAVRRTKEMDL